MGAFEGAALAGLLAGNDDHVAGLAVDAFTGLESAQDPDVVTVCCADSRVPQERMWGIDRPGTLFTPSTIGNQVWDLDGDERIVDGGVAYAVAHAGVEAIVVVGHTGCGAVDAAFGVAEGAAPPGPRGVDLWVDQLVPVVRRARDAGIVDDGLDRQTAVNRLVEHNVDEQVAFLQKSPAIGDELPVYGFVYDFQGAYGETPGRCYLVNLDGATEPEAIAEALPERHQGVARRLAPAVHTGTYPSGD